MALPFAIPAILQGSFGLFQGLKGLFDASANQAPNRGLLQQNIQNAQNVATGARARENEAQFAARRGYSPAEMQAMQSQLGQNLATGYGQIRAMGGNPGAMQNSIATLGRQQNQALLDVGAADAALQRQNKMYANQLGDVADTRQVYVNQPRMDMYQDQLNTYNMGAQSSSGLIGAGLQNIAGAGQLGMDLATRNDFRKRVAASQAAYNRAMRPENLYGYNSQMEQQRMQDMARQRTPSIQQQQAQTNAQMGSPMANYGVAPPPFANPTPAGLTTPPMSTDFVMQDIYNRLQSGGIGALTPDEIQMLSNFNRMFYGFSGI